ncbi:MAG: hypothetical protein ABIL22_01795 [candidate division WOR-3 bacterium]
MKKILTYISIVLVLGAIFGLTMHQQNIRPDNQVMGSVLEVLVPSVCYADSDTVGKKAPPPPPPPIL